MATKINEILQSLPPNSLLISSWLVANGIDSKAQTCYVRSGWLERIAHGIYKVANSTPSLYSAIAAYNSQLSKSCHIGATTALALRGYSHYGTLGREQVFIFSSAAERLPVWLINHDWGVDIRYSTTSLFGDEDRGVELLNIAETSVLVSSPEQAFMECLHLAPNDISLMDAYYIMEMLTTLRPKVVQLLLEKCSSIKVKRLFLYMAEKSAHQWFRALDISKIDLGNGNRHLAQDGVFISKYNITIPKELADYE